MVHVRRGPSSPCDVCDNNKRLYLSPIVCACASESDMATAARGRRRPREYAEGSTHINSDIVIDPKIIEMTKHSGRAHEGGRETQYEEKARLHMERLNELSHRLTAKAHRARAEADAAHAKWKRIKANPGAHAEKPRKGKKADGGEPRVPRLPQPVRTPRVAPVPRSDEDRANSTAHFLERESAYADRLLEKARGMAKDITLENKAKTTEMFTAYATTLEKVMAKLEERKVSSGQMGRIRHAWDTIERYARGDLSARAAFGGTPGLAARGESRTLSGTRFGRS